MKHFKKTLAMILAVLCLLSVFPVAFVSAYNVGDIIEYGRYPQTLIRDNVRIEQFNQIIDNAQSALVSAAAASAKSVLGEKINASKELHKSLVDDGRFTAQAQNLDETVEEVEIIYNSTRATLNDYKEAIEQLQTTLLSVKEAVDAVEGCRIDTKFIANAWVYREPSIWKSFGYYNGTDNRFDGNMTSGDSMLYYDFTHGTETYRAVKIVSLRPYYVGYSANNDSKKSYQDDFGYNAGNVYYFHYEPLKWRVLNPQTGLILCESIIDAQPFQSVVYMNNNKYYTDASSKHLANDYKHSSLHSWLTNTFFNTAFTRNEQMSIPTSLITFADGSTASERVFVPSINDVTNGGYGFANMNTADAARKAAGTDYAKCQGLFKTTDASNGAYAPWWLRDGSDQSGKALYVTFDGKVQNESATVDLNYVGIRVTCYVNGLISQDELCAFCGQKHGTSLWQRIVAFFHRIFAFIHRTDKNMG